MAFTDFSLNGNYTTMNSSNQSNSEDVYLEERRVPLIVNCALNAPLSLAAILGNTVVIYSIWNNPSLHSPSNILLFGLAVCDFGVGITVQPFYIIYQSFYLTNQRQTWRATMEVFNIISNLFCGVSFLTTTAVSIDRYLAVHLSFKVPRICHSASNCCTSCRFVDHCSFRRVNSYLEPEYYILCRRFCYNCVPFRHVRCLCKDFCSCQTSSETDSRPAEHTSSFKNNTLCKICHWYVLCLFHSFLVLSSLFRFSHSSRHV